MGGVIVIDQERCKACDYCIVFCPHNLISRADFLNSKGYYPAQFNDGAYCPGKGCNICALVCPEVAIEVYKDKEAKR